MKKKFSKILGVGLTLALLTSLLLTAAPVSANVSQPTVDVLDDEISATTTYTISFRINTTLTGITDSITVRFPEDTDVTSAAVAGTDVSFTSGIGYDSGATTSVTDTPDVAECTVEIVLTGFDNLPAGIGAMAYVQVVITGVKNPTEPGTYTLEVQTNEEDTYVESESYDIDIPVVGGFVYVYNPSNILLATFGGKTALDVLYADAADYFDQEDYTIKVGPGTYSLAADIIITGEGLTLESSEGAADTILEDNGFIINASVGTGTEVTIDGFTLDGAAINAISVDAGTDALITNCVITDATTAGIAFAAVADLDTTVSDNVIEDCATGISFAVGGPTDLGDVDITGNVITGSTANGAIVFDGGNVDIDITGNTITGNDVSGIFFVDASPGFGCDDIDIVGNNISENEAIGIEIWEDTDAPTDLIIKGNVIADNEDEGILMRSWTALSNYIMFNDISGNDTDITNNSAVAVNARFNWWGTEVEDDFDISADVDYEPWLMGEQATIVSGYAVAVNDVSSLSGKADAGVNVSGMDDDAALGADIISAAKYIANPEEAIADVIGFYDVYVNLDAIITATTIDEVTAKLKFYDSAITTGSTAHFWTGDFWAECSDQLARDGIIYVTVTEDTVPALDELEGTKFAVVAGEAVGVLDAPVIAAPASGATGVSLTPTFAWTAVADADGYYFQFADNANFVVPLAKLDGDLGRLVVTAYAHAGELPYSTAYYWRVKAVSGTEAAGDLAESIWASGVFITMDEPEEPIPPVVIEDVPPPIIEQPDIIIEIPEIVVPLPAETPITPAWIYVIIGVGAVLVIGLIVLIVRTRRIA